MMHYLAVFSLLGFFVSAIFIRFRVMALGDRASIDRFLIPLFTCLCLSYVSAYAMLRTDQAGGGLDIYAHNGYGIGAAGLGGLLGATLGIWNGKKAIFSKDPDGDIIRCSYFGLDKFIMILTFFPFWGLGFLLHTGTKEFARDFGIIALFLFWLSNIFVKNIVLLWRYKSMGVDPTLLSVDPFSRRPSP